MKGRISTNSSSASAGELHEDEVGLHGHDGLVAVGVGAVFGGDGPEVFAVEEDLGVGHVVEAVDLRLQGEDVFGVADVAAEVRGHGAGVFEEAGEDAAVGGDDGVGRVEDVEGGGAVVGVDDDFDAVADVVYGVVAEAVVGGVGVGVGGGVGVDDPGEAAVVADDEVGVLVEGEEGGKGRDAIADVAAHEQAAVGGYVVARRGACRGRRDRRQRRMRRKKLPRTMPPVPW